MQNPNSKLGKFAILDELAEMCKSILLGVRYKLDEVEHALYDSSLKFVTTLIPEDSTKEG